MAKKVAFTEKDLKQRAWREFLGSSITAVFACLVCGIEVGACKARYGTEDIFGVLLHITDQLEKPLDIFPNDLETIGMFMFIAFFIVMRQLIRYNKMKDVDLETAHGSGGFNEDIKGYYRDFVHTIAIVKGKTKPNDELKPVSAKIDVLTGKSPRASRVSYFLHKYKWAVLFACLTVVAEVVLIVFK